MAIATTGYELGDTVSYKPNLLSNWRDARVIAIDATDILPLTIEDLESGNEYSVDVKDVV